jgi:hypothetical protein
MKAGQNIILNGRLDKARAQRCTQKAGAMGEEIIICRATDLSKRVGNLHLNLVIDEFPIRLISCLKGLKIY